MDRNLQSSRFNICKRNFDNFFVYFECSFFLFFRPNTSLKTIPKKVNLRQLCDVKVLQGSIMSGFVISLLTGVEHG